MSLWSSVFCCCLVLGSVHASSDDPGVDGVPIDVPEEFQATLLAELKREEDLPNKSQVHTVPLTNGGHVNIDWAGCVYFSKQATFTAERVSHIGTTAQIHLQIEFGSIRYVKINPDFVLPDKSMLMYRGFSLLKLEYKNITAHIHLQPFYEDWNPATNAGKGLIIERVQLDTAKATEIPVYTNESRGRYETFLNTRLGLNLTLLPTLKNIMEDGIYQKLRRFLEAANAEMENTTADAKSWKTEQAEADKKWDLELNPQESGGIIPKQDAWSRIVPWHA